MYKNIPERAVYFPLNFLKLCEKREKFPEPSEKMRLVRPTPLSFGTAIQRPEITEI